MLDWRFGNERRWMPELGMRLGEDGRGARWVERADARMSRTVAETGYVGMVVAAAVVPHILGRRRVFLFGKKSILATIMALLLRAILGEICQSWEL